LRRELKKQNKALLCETVSHLAIKISEDTQKRKARRRLPIVARRRRFAIQLFLRPSRLKKGADPAKIQEAIRLAREADKLPAR
jgi:hypothetical protein